MCLSFAMGKTNEGPNTPRLTKPKKSPTFSFFSSSLFKYPRLGFQFFHVKTFTVSFSIFTRFSCIFSRCFNVLLFFFAFYRVFHRSCPDFLFTASSFSFTRFSRVFSRFFNVLQRYLFSFFVFSFPRSYRDFLAGSEISLQVPRFLRRYRDFFAGILGTERDFLAGSEISSQVPRFLRRYTRYRERFPRWYRDFLAGTEISSQVPRFSRFLYLFTASCFVFVRFSRFCRFFCMHLLKHIVPP